MAKINPEHIKALLDLINHGPYFELLSMKVCQLDVGYSRVEDSVGFTSIDVSVNNLSMINSGKKRCYNMNSAFFNT